MKKILLFIISCVAFTACDKNNDQNIVPGSTGNAVSISEATIPPIGNELESERISFTVTSDVAWRIHDEPSWLNIYPSSGGAGTTQVKMYAGVNRDPDPYREGVVIIESSDRSFSETITVFQERPYLEISRESINFNWDHCDTFGSAREEIVIRCNTDWQINSVMNEPYAFSSMLSRAQDDHQIDWLLCSEIQGSAVTEDHVLYFNPETYNIEREPKNLKLVISGVLDEYELDFSQNNLLFIVDIAGSEDNEHCNFAACNTEYVDMTVESERDWRLYSKPDWLLVNPTDGSSLTNVKFNIDGANPNADDRVGELVLVAEVNTNPLPQRVIEITQKGYEFVITTDNATISNTGSSLYGYINSSGSWEIDNSTIPGWLNVSTLSGAGSARESLQFSVNEQNLELSPRVANLKFRSTQYGNTMSQDVKIEQDKFIFDATLSEPSIGTIQKTSHDLEIQSSGKWAIDVLYDDSSSEEWLNVEQLQGEGNAVVKYNAKTENPIDEDRSATISIRSITHEEAGISEVVQLPVVQRKYIFEVEPSPNDLSLSYEAVDQNTINIFVNCSAHWSIDCPDWLIPSLRDGSNYADVTFRVENNRATTARDGKLVIKSVHYGVERSYSFDVHQDGFRFNSTTAQFTNLEALDARICEVDIVCSGGWELSGEGNWRDWITPSSMSGYGDAPLEVKVADNVQTSPRNTTFYVTSTLNPNMRKRVDISQKAFIFDTTTTNVPEFAAVDVTEARVVLGECMSTWTVRDIPSWLNVSPAAGEGAMTLRITPQENVNVEMTPRDATIQVVSDRNPALVKNIKITQAAFIFDTSTVNVPEFGAYNPIAANVTIGDCTSTWSVVEVPDWLTIQPKSGAGSGRITITPSSNLTAVARSATFYIESDKNSSLRKRISVSQGRYILEASTSSVNVPAKPSSSYSVNVSCSGRWKAECSADWLSLGSVTSGSGNGTINFTVSDNTSTTARSATIIISSTDGYTATVNINVTQAAGE